MRIKFVLLTICILLILVGCGEEVEETAVFPSPTPKPTVVPTIIATAEHVISTIRPSPTPTINTKTPSFSAPPTPTPPIPDDRITQTTSFFPNNHGVVNVRISDHFQPNADEIEQFPNGKYHINMVVTDNYNEWTVIDEWREAGMGETYPEIVRWSVDGRYFYYANIPKPDGCSLFVNGGDLWRFDLEGGTITEIAPYLGLVMALSPDERKLAVHASYGRGFLIRDLATGEEQPIPLPEREGGWQINGLQWSPDGEHLLLTQAVDACGGGGEMKTAVIRINPADLSATTILEPDERNFTLLEWGQDDEIRLQNTDGAIWHLDPLADEWVFDEVETSQTGLIYQTTDGLWQSTDSGQPRLLLSQTDVELSPDGRHALYQDEENLIIVELATGEENPVDLSMYDEYCCARWGGNELVFLATLPNGEERGLSYGFLTAVSTDGSYRRVLEPENQFGSFPALSPDNHTIAHQNFELDQRDRLIQHGFRLIQLDGTAETVDLTSFSGFPDSSGIWFVSPAWSPDGSQLAWIIGGSIGEDNEYQVAIAVFDMERKTAVILHPHKNVFTAATSPIPAWSPDGRWLAFRTDDEEYAQRGIWLAAVDGSEEHFMGGSGGNKLVWSPDGRYLLFGGWDSSAEKSFVLMADVEKGTTVPLDLPSGAVVVDWME